MTHPALLMAVIERRHTELAETAARNLSIPQRRRLLRSSAQTVLLRTARRNLHRPRLEQPA